MFEFSSAAIPTARHRRKPIELAENVPIAHNLQSEEEVETVEEQLSLPEDVYTSSIIQEHVEEEAEETIAKRSGDIDEVQYRGPLSRNTRNTVVSDYAYTYIDEFLSYTLVVSSDDSGGYYGHGNFTLIDIIMVMIIYFIILLCCFFDYQHALDHQISLLM